MKQLQLVVLIGVGSLFLGCETTQQAGMGNQEQKRQAALQRQQQQPQPDESDRNLWNAQHDTMVRDSNPAIRY